MDVCSRVELVVRFSKIATVALADGVYSRSFEGSGTVIHHDPHTGLGLVVVDRNTVPVASCDILVSFAAFPCESPGKVEYLHPTHNFAIVSYDASKLPKRAADAVKPIAFGERFWFSNCLPILNLCFFQRPRPTPFPHCAAAMRWCWSGCPRS